MKRALILGLISCNALAHSFQPGEIKEYVVTPVNEYSFNLVNTSKSNECFTFEENEKPSLIAPVCLAAGASRRISFYTYTPPDEITHNMICSMKQEKFGAGVGMRIKLCSNVITYLPHSVLEAD